MYELLNLIQKHKKHNWDLRATQPELAAGNLSTDMRINMSCSQSLEGAQPVNMYTYIHATQIYSSVWDSESQNVIYMARYFRPLCNSMLRCRAYLWPTTLFMSFTLISRSAVMLWIWYYKRSRWFFFNFGVNIWRPTVCFIQKKNLFMEADLYNWWLCPSSQYIRYVKI